MHRTNTEKKYNEDDLFLTGLLTFVVTLVIMGLLLIAVFSESVPKVKCDLGDNKSLELDVSNDDEFDVPTGSDAESVRSCKIHK